MKRFRICLAAVLLLAAFAALATLSANAVNPVESGQCGPSLSWSLNTETGHLTISGTGPMSNYYGVSPWYNVRTYIRTVEFSADVTHIGDYTFTGCSNLTEITFPKKLASIGNNAFYSCRTLKSIVLPEGLVTLGTGAFRMCIALDSIRLPSTLTSVSNYAFGDTSPSFVLYDGSEEQWSSIHFGRDNDNLTGSVIHHPSHVYDREIATEPYLRSTGNCVTDQTYYHSCVCGQTGTTFFVTATAPGHQGGEATCIRQATCSACGIPYGDFGDHVPATPAQCLEDQLCSLCQIVLSPALGHEYQVIVTMPTCTADGYTTHTCTRCEHTYQDAPTTAIGHAPGDEATCTTAQLCTTCQAEITRPLGHDHIQTITLQPSCTTDGLATYTCSRCDDTYTEPLSADGHTPGAVETCISPRLCITCGVLLAEPLGHIETTEVVPPTCTMPGYTIHTCTRCEKSRRDTFMPVTEHISGGSATCTDAELCSACGTLMSEAHGHAFRDTVVPPSCTERGYTRRDCTRCNRSYETGFISATGHTSGGAATCTRDELCSTCGYRMAKALGHSYRDTTVAPTCTERGYTRRDCTRCSSTYEMSFTTAQGHASEGTATCTRDELCATCGVLMSKALGHDYRKEVTEPTCTAAGMTRNTCARCAATFVSDTRDPLSHTPGNWIEDAKPTVTKPGSAHKECTACGVTLETKTITYGDPPPSTQETVPVEPDSESESDTTLQPGAETDTDTTTSTTRPATRPSVPEDPDDPDPDYPDSDDFLDSMTDKASDDEGCGGCSGCGESCGSTGGNLLVICLFLLAAFLFWYIDYRRRV